MTHRWFICVFALAACWRPVALDAKSKPAAKPAVTIPPSFARKWDQAPARSSEWWTQFGDRELDELIRLALANNRDIALAKARLLESRLGQRAASQARMPQVNAGFGLTESTRSNNSPAIPRIDPADRPPGIPDLIPRRYGVFESGFDASYEFDLFGAQRNTVQAARHDADAEREQLRDTLLSVVAEVARQYWTLREAQTRLGFARQTEASFEESLHLADLRTRAGLANESGYLDLKSQLASARAARAPIAASIDQSLYALAALTGQPHNKLAHLVSESGAGVPATVAPIPAGLPSELLERRPDIRRAAAQWKAATARRKSAEKDWFPKFKLTSATGGQSGEVANLLSAGSFFSQFAPKVTWGLLQFQQTRTNINRRQAQEQQQLAALEAAILTALRDVDTAMSSLSLERQRLEQWNAALETDRSKLLNVRQLYAAGLTSYLPVLESERAEIASLDRQAQAQAALARAFIALHKALGGGWQGIAVDTP